MKTALLSSAMLLALVSAGHAATLDVKYSGLPSGGNYFAPTAISASDPYEQYVTGSTVHRTSPFYDDTTKYDAVEAGGSATFGLPILTLAASKAFSPIFGVGDNTFKFVWGTPDTYNVLSFYNGAEFLGSVTGSGSPTKGDGTGSYLATVTGMGAFNRVVFETGNSDAFEFAAISAVPLPATAPLFAAALLALAGLGFGLNRPAARQSGHGTTA